MFSVKDFDILIIGSGGAGAMAAIEASVDPNLKVAVLSRAPMGQCGLTPTANGGTANAAKDQPNGVQEFFDFMIKAGDYLNDQDLAWLMAEKSVASIQRVAALGVEITPYKKDRCCLPSVGTLKEVRAHLTKRPNVSLLEDVLVTRLLKDDGRISGVIAIELRTGNYLVCQARVVVLTTGGCVGELYPLSSDNPFGVSSNAAGVGHMMALQAGAELVDMEMIQFVPIPIEPRACLNLRFFPDFWACPYYDCHGNVLVQDPTRFVGGSYSYPFTRMVYETEKRGDGPVYIDQGHDGKPVPKGGIGIWNARRGRFDLLDINPFKQKIKLSIGSHFNMGGVRADASTQTCVPGLLVAGEVHGAVHGGLRVSGFSFTQMVVFGLEAGHKAAELARVLAAPPTPDRQLVAKEQSRLERFFEPKPSPASVVEVRKWLQQIMQRDVFLVRNEESLTCARQEIKALREQALPQVQVHGGRRFNLEWVRAIELESTLGVAAVVVEAALARDESRGFHFRADHPKAVDPLPRHTVIRWQDGEFAVRKVAVDLCRCKPEVQA
jgi:succinate dehydrogenase/fumarate reductase flavoprotein subunit